MGHDIGELIPCDDWCDDDDEPTVEVLRLESSWTQRAEERIRGRNEEYRCWHLAHFGRPLTLQKHISTEEIHAEKDRMLQEQQEELDELHATVTNIATNGL